MQARRAEILDDINRLNKNQGWIDEMSTRVPRDIGLASIYRCRMSSRYVVLAAIIGSALSGCGGGGGGSSGSSGGNGSGSTGNGSATLVVSPLQVNVTAYTTSPAPAAIVQVGVQVGSNAGTQTKFYIEGSTTQHGIQSVSSSANGPYDDITLTFKTPASLGLGTYTDTITLKGCVDQACADQISNSPQTISVTYTIALAQSDIVSTSPTSVPAGAPSFTLTVNGEEFTPQSAVLWNGSRLTTSYVSPTQLTAQVPASNVTVAGSYTITATNGSGVGVGDVIFTVTPIPTLALGKISPSQVSAGGSSFVLTAIGTGFKSTSSITWNGAALSTTYVSSTILQAQVTAAQIANTANVPITVSDSASHSTSSTIDLAIAVPSVDAVAYQMNAAHTGAVTFQTLALPANSAWSVDVGGTASYALIVGGQVFVTVAASNDNSQLLALNATTGATLWGPIAFPGQVNAAYDGGQLFVVSGTPSTQTISALSAATGNTVWSATVPGTWFPEPPVAADGIVYATNGGIVTAFDEITGATLWQHPIGGTDGIVAVSVDGLYAASPCSAVDLQPALGTQIWFSSLPCSGGGGATPVVANGLAYQPQLSAGSSGTVFDAETGATKGSYTASVIPAFSSSTGFFLSGGTLQGRALSNNQVLWSFAGDGQLDTAPIVVNNYVFIGSQSGNLYALDATSGQQVWAQNMGAAIPAINEHTEIIYSGLAAGDGLLLVPSGTKVTAFLLSTNP
jgi:outer membrane protein assembly factor BamB